MPLYCSPLDAINPAQHSTGGPCRRPGAVRRRAACSIQHGPKYQVQLTRAVITGQSRLLETHRVPNPTSQTHEPPEFSDSESKAPPLFGTRSRGWLEIDTKDSTADLSDRSCLLFQHRGQNWRIVVQPARVERDSDRARRGKKESGQEVTTAFCDRSICSS